MRRQTPFLEPFLVRFILALSISSILPIESFAQTNRSLRIERTWRFGGSSNDTLSVVRQVSDGGFVIGGYSNSGPGGNKASPKYGERDWWVVRVNPNGDRRWDMSYGGASDPLFGGALANDYLTGIVQLSDGGFLLVGPSYESTGGTKTSPGIGSFDLYVVRTDGEGLQLWDKTFGRAQNDSALSVRQTSDGGFILAGHTAHLIGTPPPYVEDVDCWVLRLDASGNRLWERTFGGEGPDQGVDVVQTADGGYLVAGNSASPPSAAKTSPYYGGGFMSDFGGDFWVLRLDAGGNKLWEQSYGGTYDETLYGIQLTDDGGALLVGESYSKADGNKNSPLIGYFDAWAVRIDATGQKLWDKAFGGTWLDRFRCVQTGAAHNRHVGHGGGISF